MPCLAGCSKPDSPPSSAPTAGTPAACTTGTCPKCCCCVTSIAIQNITPYNNGSQFGHNFDVVMNMNFAGGSGGTVDCTLEWWEKTNIPYFAVGSANTWTQLYGVVASPTFDPWNNRTIPCPAGGSVSATITDVPGLGIQPGRTAKRTLEFKLVVKSGAGCSCGSASVTATATQVLEITNGVPTHPGSFTTP